MQKSSTVSEYKCHPNEEFYFTELLPSRQLSKEPPGLAELRIKANALAAAKPQGLKYFSPHMQQALASIPPTPTGHQNQPRPRTEAPGEQESGCTSLKCTSLDGYLHTASKKQVRESDL